MRTDRCGLVVLVALFAALVVMPSGAAAQEARAIVCTPNDPIPGDGQMELVIVADSGAVQINSVTASNATPATAGVAQGALSCMGSGPQTCTLLLTQVAPGAASWSANIADTGGGAAVNCGPYTNANGLPVELLSFEVE